VALLPVGGVATVSRSGIAAAPLCREYLIPPAGLALPSPEVMLTPEFTWPEVDLPVHGFAMFRTAAQEWQELNRTVGTFNGSANPGAGTLVIEAKAFVPTSVAAHISA
jgi:hypothetical protein